MTSFTGKLLPGAGALAGACPSLLLLSTTTAPPPPCMPLLIQLKKSIRKLREEFA
jgi:hypothetical protein